MDQVAEGLRSPEKPIAQDWIPIMPILFPIPLTILQIGEGLRLCCGEQSELSHGIPFSHNHHLIALALVHQSRRGRLCLGRCLDNLIYGPGLNPGHSVSAQMLEQVDQNRVLWPHVALVPVELIVPMAGTLID